MSERPPTSMKHRATVTADAKRYLQTISKVPMGRGVVEYAPPLDRAEVVTIASEIVNLSITSDQNGRYYLPCPGLAMHSGGKSARRDCEFMPDGAPTLRCFHTSCGAVLDEINRSIRSACGKAKVRKFSDATARATKAAEALTIGFDMAEADARVILNDWALTCTPPINSGDIAAGLKSARASYRRAPESAGCLLNGNSMPAAISPPRPPSGEKVSVVSGGCSMSKPTASQGVQREEPIYLGELGALAKQAREMIDDYEYGYGCKPAAFLVGTSYLGPIPERLCGIPTDRWDNKVHTCTG